MTPTLRSLAVAGALLGLSFTAPGAAAPGEPPGPLGPAILHIPVLERRAEHGILRPMPISAELPRDLALRARRVLVRYRLWGDPDWTTLELRRNATRFEGAIPCLEISSITGDVRYYIRVYDAEGRVIATGASRSRPYLVAIKHDEALEPGAPRALKCPDPADCPAGLPGCPSERIVEIVCQTDRDCEDGTTCGFRGYCERADRRRSWVALAVEQDLGVLHRSGACGIPAQENEGYACYRDDGVQYIGSPVLTNEPVGVGRGPTRVVLGFERLIYFDTTLGARAGWAISGEGPTSRGGTPFVPLSASLRATHWFGDDPFARSGFRPFAFVAAGYKMTDLKTTVHIREIPAARHNQSGNDLEQTADLWKRAGDGFVGVGGGLALAFGPGSAAFVEVEVSGVFPASAVVLAPSAGVMFGF